jgi:hypothetical protein
VKPLVPLVFLLLTPLAGTGAADSLSQLTVSKTQIDVLAGRLKVSVPTVARLQPVQHGIMAAPEADNEQTRILIDAGDQRMVLMVYELFARAATDFEGEAQKETARFPMKVNLQKWTLSGSVRAMAYFPVVPTKDQEANLVMGVFVAGPDGSVQNLVWYVNPAGAIQFSAASNLAQSIAKTIAPGVRGLDITSGVRELSVYSKTKSVFVTVPQGYVVTTQHGPDFIVHHVHKVMAFGDPEASLGVYLGDHPPANDQGFLEQGMSTLFGKKVPWYQKVTNEDSSRTIMARSVVSLGPSLLGHALPGMSDGPSYADVFVAASDSSTVEELKSIATSLRLGDRNAQH